LGLKYARPLFGVYYLDKNGITQGISAGVRNYEDFKFRGSPDSDPDGDPGLDFDMTVTFNIPSGNTSCYIPPTPISFTTESESTSAYELILVKFTKDDAQMLIRAYKFFFWSSIGCFIMLFFGLIALGINMGRKHRLKAAIIDRLKICLIKSTKSQNELQKLDVEMKEITTGKLIE